MAVGFSSKDSEVDLDSLRARLRKMTTAELERYVGAAECMCSPDANFGKPPRPTFVIQRQEAKEEQDRRKATALSSAKSPERDPVPKKFDC
jgi:hypothetical protein